ncbi:MAG: dockerin type I domain-containing protein, partial [Planctomycetota bacterium]|nr:dockerin type I domain-containing protein [Planctomycetota bacterium]
MESLDARVVLAGDSFIGPLPESIVASVEPQIVATAEAEATPVVAYNYDVNRDGQIAPIDALWVVNAVVDVAAGVPVAEERFAATDVNSDGALTDADVALMIEHIEATMAAASGASALLLVETEGPIPCEENPACDPPTTPTPSPTPTPPTPTPTPPCGPLQFCISPPTPTPPTPTPTPTTPTPTPTCGPLQFCISPPTPTPPTPTPPTPTPPTPTPPTPTPPTP